MTRPSVDAGLRAWLEYVAQTAIDMLDDLDVVETEREPDAEDEVISEDDGVVVSFRPVGRQSA